MIRIYNISIYYCQSLVLTIGRRRRRVRLHVGLHVAAEREPLPAGRALVGLLARVQEEVVPQVGGLAEAPAAHRAAVRPRPAVDVRVRPQVPRRGEGLPADAALVGLLLTTHTFA